LLQPHSALRVARPEDGAQGLEAGLENNARARTCEDRR
jgi:hypothetical protein